MKNVMGSEAETEVVAHLYNGQEAEPIRTSLHEMGHTQPETPIQTDNYSANGISKNTVHQKWYKYMDMRFYWVQDQIKQDHFHIWWKLDTTTLGDYFTKHHLSYHNR